jgi:hypothetical protein
MAEKKESNKKGRYNIRPVRMEDVERKVNKGLERLDHVGKEINAGRRIAAGFNDRFQDSCGGIADWILGPNTSNRGQQQERQASSGLYGNSRGGPYSNQDHDDEPRQQQSRQRKGSNGGSGTGKVHIEIEITDRMIADALYAADIDPEGVPREFYAAVRDEFEFQLNEGIRNNMDPMLAKTIDNVDRKFTEKYGRS